MRIKLYVDIGAESKKENLYFSQTPISCKMAGYKRFEVEFNIPDPDDLVDYCLNAAKVEEVKEVE